MSITSAPIPVPGHRTADRRVALLGLVVWGLVALALAAAGVITLERRALVPLIIVSSVLVLVALYVRSPSLRSLADGVDLRVPILLHAIRAPIGVAFLVLVPDGLDADFARMGGYGDIASGGLALVAAAFVGRPSERLVVRAWNVLGLTDIVLTVLTAQRIILFSDHPESLSLLVRFPFALLPLFVVPLVIATHLLVFRRTSPSFAPRV